jgi:recombination protein RecT
MNSTAIATFQSDLGKMQPQFKAALPAHIAPEKFVRVVQTAVSLTPDLLNADRRTLFGACTKCAQDGLLPDGREAALVTFRANVGSKQAPKYELHVQYMPMVSGIMKKVRNSGTIANWSVHVVKDGDVFDYELGDQEKLTHKPSLKNRGKTIAAYSIVKLKGGEVSREIMSVEEIEAVRSRSRAKDTGPWVTDYDEMCKKTVIRRHSKRLEMNTEDSDAPLANVIRADDALNDFEPEPVTVAVTQPVEAPKRPRRLAAVVGEQPKAEPETPLGSEPEGEDGELMP